MVLDMNLQQQRTVSRVGGDGGGRQDGEATQRRRCERLSASSSLLPTTTSRPHAPLSLSLFPLRAWHFETVDSTAGSDIVDTLRATAFRALWMTTSIAW